MNNVILQRTKLGIVLGAHGMDITFNTSNNLVYTFVEAGTPMQFYTYLYCS